MSDDPRSNPSRPVTGAVPGPARPGAMDLNIDASAQAAVEPAGFWVRLVAAIVDGVIVQVATLPFGLLIGVALSMVMPAAAAKAVGQVLNIAVNMAVIFYYYGWFYSNKGATPGKLFFGLKVLDADTGGHLAYGKSFVRETVGKFVSSVPLLGGFIMAGLRSDKRALHDLIARSQVIKTK